MPDKMLIPIDERTNHDSGIGEKLKPPNGDRRVSYATPLT
jgi:hypothetical protein